MLAPRTLYLNEPTTREDVLPALRELLSQHPAVTYKSPDTLVSFPWA
jgi:hypothetical protein